MMFFTVQQAESVYGEKKVFCAKLLCRKRGKVLHSIINTSIPEMEGGMGVFSSVKNKIRIPRFFSVVQMG
jgi:hypothetical protein